MNLRFDLKVKNNDGTSSLFSGITAVSIVSVDCASLSNLSNDDIIVVRYVYNVVGKFTDTSIIEHNEIVYGQDLLVCKKDIFWYTFENDSTLLPEEFISHESMINVYRNKRTLFILKPNATIAGTGIISNS